MTDTVLKPWGLETRVLTTEVFDLWRLSICDGEETSLHHHQNKDTLLIVENGCVVVTLNGTERLLGAGESILIPKGTEHRTNGMRGAVVLELEWPPNREDLVRIEDKYGRCE